MSKTHFSPVIIINRDVGGTAQGFRVWLLKISSAFPAYSYINLDSECFWFIYSQIPVYRRSAFLWTSGRVFKGSIWSLNLFIPCFNNVTPQLLGDVQKNINFDGNLKKPWITVMITWQEFLFPITFVVFLLPPSFLIYYCILFSVVYEIMKASPSD